MRFSSSVYLNSAVKPLDWIVNQVTDRLKNQSSLENLSDNELVTLSTSGNKKSFEIIVRRYQKLIYNIVFQMTKNHEQTADVTQETFLKVYRALNTFNTKREFRPWILKIARNTTLNSLRKNRKETSIDDSEVYIEPSTNIEPSKILEQKLSQQTLQEALKTIPKNQRETFLLKYQHDLSYNEISEITDLSISSIKSLLFRARESLRKKLVITGNGIEETDKESGIKQ